MLSEKILTPLLRFVTRDAFQLEKSGVAGLPGPQTGSTIHAVHPYSVLRRFMSLLFLQSLRV